MQSAGGGLLGAEGGMSVWKPPSREPPGLGRRQWNPARRERQRKAARKGTDSFMEFLLYILGIVILVLLIVFLVRRV
ncbi:MAG: hypothetical protein M3133_02555 [Actinomycetota bacterium]|nr:hypothetical protein [Actinomycetota bacterium]